MSSTFIPSNNWGTAGGARLTAIGRVVDAATYKPGWTFELRESTNFGPGRALVETALTIRFHTHDSNDPSHVIPFVHYFAGPPYEVAVDDVAAREWLLDVIMAVERHEAREFLRVNGERVDPPGHGPGEDPYG